MSDQYKKSDTEDIKVVDDLVFWTNRIALCVAACEGVDEDTLKILASKDKRGRTKMQEILNRITWAGLPVVNYT